MTTGLFQPDAPVVRPASTGFSLREYQTEDADAITEALVENQSALLRAATGLGKAVILAELARRYVTQGKVLCVVDVGKLVMQLAETFRQHTGKRVGILTGDYKKDLNADIIVSTVQSLYAGEDGDEEYRRWNPHEYALLEVDECESSVAPAFRKVVEWFTQTPSLRMVGCTATPFRSDGVAMAELYDYGVSEPGPLNRDICWGIDNGWLVKVRQGFVRTSIDFGTLKVKKNDHGEADYSDRAIAELITQEQALIEIAQGIHSQIGERKAIAICPDTASADALADYLNAEKSGSAAPVHRSLPHDPMEVMRKHYRGDFQIMTSVNLVLKGYDDPEVSATCGCRNTKSRRLYSQFLGRGTRPLKSIVDDLNAAESAEERRSIIADSEKPNTLMVNLVGVDESVRDMTVIDVLGERLGEEVKNRAKKRSQQSDEDTDPEEEAQRAQEEIDAEKEEQRKKLEQARQSFKVKGETEAAWTDDLRVKGGASSGAGSIKPNHLNLLQKFRVPDKDIERMTPERAKKLSGELIRRAKKGLATYRQCKTLKRHGYTPGEYQSMTFDEASRAIDMIAQNGWRRPRG